MVKFVSVKLVIKIVNGFWSFLWGFLYIVNNMSKLFRIVIVERISDVIREK